MQRETFRKTPAGLDEVRTRGRGLDARTPALEVLIPHDGPDALRMAEPVRAAPTRELFAAALIALRGTLSVHLGRKLADPLSRQIAHGD